MLRRATHGCAGGVAADVHGGCARGEQERVVHGQCQVRYLRWVGRSPGLQASHLHHMQGVGKGMCPCHALRQDRVEQCLMHVV